ncbi:hypothetical protein [Streptomyces sp. NPDC051546]|uniref:hypothetical protein n=1 Tax=Streptomyces sp. NPDC051546 TaxID=3365655 RepID=UPI0037AF9B91
MDPHRGRTVRAGYVFAGGGQSSWPWSPLARFGGGTPSSDHIRRGTVPGDGTLP